MEYVNEYGVIYAVKEHNGAPAILCRAAFSQSWSLSDLIEPFAPGAWTASALQAYLDNWAAVKGWRPVKGPAAPKNLYFDGRRGTSVPYEGLAPGMNAQLRRLVGEERPGACVGCGFEHNCRRDGCAVLRRVSHIVAVIRPQENEGGNV